MPRADSTDTHSAKIAVINGLRGIAILAVLYTHIFKWETPPGWHMFMIGSLPVFPFTLLSNTDQAVALFFVLSGFVLYLPYLEGRRSMSTLKDALDFYWRRAKRLLPLYYIASIVTMIVVTHPANLHTLILFMTMTFNLRQSTFMPVHDPVLWSIGLEWWMSILFPFCVMIARRIGIVQVFISVLALSLIVRFAGLSWPIINPVGMNIITNSLPARLDDFVWGMLLAWMFVRHRSEFRPMLIVPGILCVTLSCWISDAVLMAYAPWSVFPLLNLLLDVGFFLCIAGLLSESEGIAVRVVRSSVLQMFGLMCYSIYVWHFPLIFFFSPFLSVPRFALYTATLTIISVLSYRFIEFPFVRNNRMLLPVSRIS